MFDELFERSGLSLERLKTFCEITQHKGITRAAGGDSVRQSQYSRQLKELENYFGAELFVRRRNLFQLTPAGMKLLVVVNDFFSTLSTVRNEIKDLPQTIAFGAGESIFNWLLFPRFSFLHKLFPTFRFQFRNLQSKEIIRGIQESELHFGIVRDDACPREMERQKLGSINYCLFIPKSMKSSTVV